MPKSARTASVCSPISGGAPAHVHVGLAHRERGAERLERAAGMVDLGEHADGAGACGSATRSGRSATGAQIMPVRSSRGAQCDSGFDPNHSSSSAMIARLLLKRSSGVRLALVGCRARGGRWPRRHSGHFDWSMAERLIHRPSAALVNCVFIGPNASARPRLLGWVLSTSAACTSRPIVHARGAKQRGLHHLALTR